MPRWIIPVSVVAILISLVTLGLLGAAGRSAPEDTVAPEQVEEPDTSSQPTPEQETPPGGPTQPEEEQATQGEQTVEEEQAAPEDPAAQEESTTAQPGTPLPGPRTATIRITGDSSYYCSLGVIGEPETIQGRRPASYEVEVATGGTSLDTVMAACQKISPGTLGVQIRYDGEVVARDETDTRLGTVSVSWNPLAE